MGSDCVRVPSGLDQASSYGQTIQAAAFFCDDRSGGVHRVRRHGVLHSSHSARPNCGRTAAYAIGERAGEQAPRDSKLPTAAELNMMAQKYFKQQGTGNQETLDLAFENGYSNGFNKTHPQ